MTLAVAACFPWGRLKSFRDRLPPGQVLEQGVILATDSRFSFGPAAPPDDYGRKLYPLTASTGLVYAGDVTLAQRGVAAIVRYIRRRRTRSRVDPALDVGRILKALRNTESERVRLRRRPGSTADIDPLFFLLGTCDRNANAYITRYSYGSDFSPLTLLGVEALGFPEDIAVFKKTLLDLEAERWQKGELPVDPVPWQFDVLSAVRSAMSSPRRTRSIGGRIQSLVITKNGTREMNISVLREGGNPITSNDWSDVSIPMAQVHAFRYSASAASPEPEAGIVSEHILD